MEKLEQFDVNQTIKEGILEDLRTQVQGVNEALEVLKAEDIPTDLPTLKKIMVSDEAFNEWVGKAMDSYVGKLGFIPKPERKRIKEQFFEVVKKTKNERNTIAVFLSDAKYTIVQDKDGSLRYDWEEAEKGATERATKRFSNEDVEYYGMLSKVVEALRELYKWEEDHTYCHFKDWGEPFTGAQRPTAPGFPICIDHGNHLQILMRPDFKEWFKYNLGFRLGKMNPKALELLKALDD